MGKVPKSYRNALKEAAMDNPSGVTILSNRVGCSTITARKHLERLVDSGQLSSYQGTRGKVYCSPGTAKPDQKKRSKRKKTKKLKKGTAVRVVNGKKMSDGKVIRVSKSGKKIMVEVEDRKLIATQKKGKYRVRNSEAVIESA